MSYRTALICLNALGLLATGGFLTHYGIKVKWREAQTGRHMMAVSCVNFQFFAFFLWSLLAGPKAHTGKVLTVTFLSEFVAVMVWRWALLIHEQHLGLRSYGARIKASYRTSESDCSSDEVP